MNNNIQKILNRLDYIELAAEKIEGGSRVEALKIWRECQYIRHELACIPDAGWRLRSDPPARQGQRCLCRYVYDRNPDYPVYMVLSWNECCEVPHFDNEVEGVMRVTHWMEIFEPETGERMSVRG